MRFGPLAVALTSLVLLNGRLVAQDAPPPQDLETEAAAASGAPDPQPSGLVRIAEEAGSPEAGAELDSTPDRRVAVLMLAALGVEQEAADNLTELAIGVVAQHWSRAGTPVQIVGKEEFQAQLGRTEAGSIDCVTTIACIGRLGVELGVDEVVAGTIARRADLWVFNINRIDTHSGELLGRVFREVAGDLDSLAAAIENAVIHVYSPEARLGVLLVSTNVEGARVLVDGQLAGVYGGEAIRIDHLDPGNHQVLVMAADHVEWGRTVMVGAGATIEVEAALLSREGGGLSSLIWLGAGASVAAGGAALYFGLSAQREPAPDATRASAALFMDDRRRDGLFTNVAIGLGLAGLATVAIGIVLSDGPHESRQGTLRLRTYASPGGLGVAGQF